MAGYPATSEDLVSLASFVGAGADRYTQDVTTKAATGLGQVDAGVLAPGGFGALGPYSGGAVGFPAPSQKQQNPSQEYLGYGGTLFAHGDPWFGKIIVFPKSVSLGNVLSTTEVELTIYNSFSDTNHFLVDLNNLVDAGVSITDLPSLPATLPYKNSLTLTVQVSTNGPANINGFLELIFDLYTCLVEFDGTRVVMFPFQPEAPLVEKIEFLTDVLVARDGSEQRIKLRKSPRQSFDFRVRSDGDTRRAMNTLITDRQSGVFGVPMWHEPTFLTQDAVTSDTTIQVVSTNYADYRVGSLAILLVDRTYLVALEVESLTATSITFSSPLGLDFDVGTIVMPVRLCTMNSPVSGSLRSVKEQQITAKFNVTDNDGNLGDASAYPSLDSYVYLNNLNWMSGGTSADSLLREMRDQDRQTGAFTRDSLWGRSIRSGQRGFITNGRQALWELRALLHHLSGKLVSFLTPTFYDDLQPVSGLVMGSPDLVIENIGYNAFIQDRKTRFRVLFVDGTELTRELSSSAETSATTETLTMTETWPSSYALSDIDRIEYIEERRLDSDTIEIEHLDANGTSRVTVPTREIIS